VVYGLISSGIYCSVVLLEAYVLRLKFALLSTVLHKLSLSVAPRFNIVNIDVVLNVFRNT